MDKTIEQVKQLAHRYGVPKLVLFGSRARGDYRARSDYDFAVWGCTAQQRAQFSDAVENDLDSLYSVDLVFVSEQHRCRIASKYREGRDLLAGPLQYEIRKSHQCCRTLA